LPLDSSKLESTPPILYTIPNIERALTRRVGSATPLGDSSQRGSSLSLNFSGESQTVAARSVSQPQITRPNLGYPSTDSAHTDATVLANLQTHTPSTADTARRHTIDQETFMSLVSSIFKQESHNLNPPGFIFRKCPFAAAHNATVLEAFDLDLDRFIRHHHPSQISFGSEFKPTSSIEPLLGDHPLWPRLKEILLNGATFPLLEMSEEDRAMDIDFHKNRGNHKSLSKYATFINPIISEDIERGFALPLPLNILEKITKASLAPLGCHKQTTIDMNGKTVPKYRLTHDQSFPGPSGKSVNLRVRKDLLPPIMYSSVLSRLLHYIVNIRFRLPNVKIFICKVDLDAAYRRCSLSSSTSWESMTIFDGLVLVALRMTFGGSPCPHLWGVISETIADLANVILHNPFWDYNELYDPLSDTIEHPDSLPDAIPFHQAKELAVSLPDNLDGYVDIYIDDNLGVVPDIGDNTKKMNRVIPLAIHTLSRPEDPNDIIPRRDIISMKKFKAEGRLEEVKKVLGWDLNTRSMKLSLPADKLRNWTNDLKKMLSSKKSHHKFLESTIGRINHVACVLPPMRHYMGRLYQALQRSAFSNSWTSFSPEELADLGLIIKFLEYAGNGVSLNNLVFRRPTLIYRSDASEFGLGGYNITSGIGWRLELPVDCRLRTSLNSLEFLGCLINIWMDHSHGVIDPESCILSQTDSSSAMGWLRKSNFADKPDEAVQLATARKLADLLLESESCLYSQWFPGSQNSIADSLSRDFHIGSSNLANSLLSHFPEQAPFGLVILPVPPDIVSWLTSLLLKQPQKELWCKAPTQSKFAIGLDSDFISTPLVYPLTPTWTDSPSSRERRSYVPSLTPLEKADLVMAHLVKPSSQNQCEPPWTAYHRPLSWLTGQTQDLIETESLHYFYNVNFEDIDPLIPHQNPNQL